MGHIWLEEAIPIIIITIFLALLFALIYSFLELVLQKNKVYYLKLLLHNIYFSLIGGICFNIWFNLMGWARDLLGGEELTTAICLLVTTVLLICFKYYSRKAIYKNSSTHKLLILLPVLLLISPMIMLFMYMVALKGAFMH